MFDPAALGTAIIGLEAVRRDGDGSSPRRPRPARARRVRGGTRHRVAAALRRMAERIEPAPLPAW